jgi:hypothetical protein
MKAKDDSNQGSLFADGDLPQIERGKQSSTDQSSFELATEPLLDQVSLRIRRQPGRRFSLKKWWEALTRGQ